MYNEICKKVKQVADNNGLQYYASWGIEGGRGWIWLKQDDEKKFKVQIFTNDGFEKYSAIKKQTVEIMEEYNCVLCNDEDVARSSFSYRHNLYFIDHEGFNKMEEDKELRYKQMAASQFNIGTFNANGSNIVFGDAVNTSQMIDNSIHEIEKLIEEKGGDDKAELHDILNEVKIIVESLDNTGIPMKPGFAARLNAHVVKHGWFYGAVLQLLGTATLSLIS